MAQFQCNFCWVLNLRERPARDLPSNNKLLGLIRQVNLNIFWRREPGTISSALTHLKKGHALLKSVGLKPIDLLMTPWPVGDGIGFQAAMEMLMASMKPGKNDLSYTQYDQFEGLALHIQTSYQ